MCWVAPSWRLRDSGSPPACTLCVRRSCMPCTWLSEPLTLLGHGSAWQRRPPPHPQSTPSHPHPSPRHNHRNSQPELARTYTRAGTTSAKFWWHVAPSDTCVNQIHTGRSTQYRLVADPPLPLCRYHQYKFIVDGEWRHDETQPFMPDPLGNVNNWLFVRKPDSSSSSG